MRLLVFISFIIGVSPVYAQHQCYLNGTEQEVFRQMHMDRLMSEGFVFSTEVSREADPGTWHTEEFHELGKVFMSIITDKSIRSIAFAITDALGNDIPDVKTIRQDNNITILYLDSPGHLRLHYMVTRLSGFHTCVNLIVGTRIGAIQEE